MANNEKIQRQKVIVATFYQSKAGAKPVLDWLKSKVLSDADRQVIGSDCRWSNMAGLSASRWWDR